MSLAPGTRLGAYQIVAQIGAGGMGEVYRAHDTKLNRDVAIKVLPSAMANDSDRLARFSREAHVLASLNHPNIAHIYGLEESDGTRALVMELVEGPTLAERIAEGPVSFDEALPIAKQIAEALESAHEQGIIHRDLKPANVKLRSDGTLKVLDFGLAKALEPTGVMSPSATQSPTITSPAMMTGVGVLLGTAAYMSPEQAKGRAADKRSDVWAFGCVLYEMLTGKRAFDGEDVSDTLAAVLRGEPNWTALPASTPSAIRRVLRHCLEKDHRRRFASIADARIEMDDASAEPATASTTVAETTRRWRWTAAIASTVAATLAAALTVLFLRVLSPQPVSSQRSVTRVELNLPLGVESYVGHAQAVAFSPDGTSVAFVGVLNGIRQLFLRRLDEFEATPLLRGTAQPAGCFFSPDGLWLGVLDVSSRRLMKVSLSDGLVVPLVSNVDWDGGGVWGSDDRLTFSREGALWQVPSRGGAATQLTRVDKTKGELSHNWPTLTPDGKNLLFTVVTGPGRDAARIEALTLATGARQVVVDQGSFPLYTSSGHLIFFRNNALLAARFDVNRLAVTGSPMRVLEQLPVTAYSGVPIVSLSNTGGLVYPPSLQTARKIVRVSRQSVEQPLYDTPGMYVLPRLAQQGQHLVIQYGGDLWILDIARKGVQPLTSKATGGNQFPVWSADGAHVVFRTQTGLAWIVADGSGRSGTIAGTYGNDYPSSVSPDGTLAFIRITSDTSADVYALSLRGEPNPHPVIKSPAYEGGPQFSPDGRWLAYVSDASGQPQVYVRAFPGPGGPVTLVSTQGGTQPRWNPNGKELFYRNGHRMMVVDVTMRPALVLSPPRVLFEQRYSYGVGGTIANYDVGPDGQYFVMVKDESASGQLNVVLNWTEELKRLIPTN